MLDSAGPRAAIGGGGPATLYVSLKHLHVACAALSGALFALRGVWMLRSSPRLGARWVRVVPHANDTVLLASALALVVLSGQHTALQPWLAAKLGALVVYIGLGLGALRFGPTRPIRAACWVAGLVVFAYIVRVALTKSPWPWSPALV